MPEPISFPTETNTFALPLLFAGQAQKEFFVNQALVMIDGLLSQSVIATHDAPPGAPTEGDSYRVGNNAASDWQGRDHEIAIWVGGVWQFITPIDGMRIFDRDTGQMLFFRAGWIEASTATDPQGGSVVDTEARAAIAELSQALRDFGLLQIAS